MRPSDALKSNRESIRHAVESHRAENARVFGSVLDGTDAEGSDLDLLVDPLPDATLLDLGGLQADLEEMLGVRVDLLTPGDLPAKYRNRVLREALPI